jgi:hypothetical protein
MMVQEFVGSTTIVPQVSFVDYFRVNNPTPCDISSLIRSRFLLFLFLSSLKLFSDPKLGELYKYFQVGSVAAYEHTAMIKLHYSLVDTMDACIEKLEFGKRRRKTTKQRTRFEVPASKNQRLHVVVPESQQFASTILSPTSADEVGEVNGSRASFSSDTVGFYDDDDEDEYERNWVKSDFD